jgi:hypothetical protein
VLGSDEMTTGWVMIAFSPTVDEWDGPYTTYQEGKTDSNGYPLDPWGTPYRLGWNDTEQVMVIYSAGLDKAWDTSQGDVITTDDDLLYKFR